MATVLIFGPNGHSAPKPLALGKINPLFCLNTWLH